MSMTFEQHCRVIAEQSELAASHVDNADLTVAVPSCPGWNVGQLLRHLGGGQRWATEIVHSGARRPPPDDHFRDLTPYAAEDPAVLAPWLRESGADLAQALWQAGPGAPMWTPTPDGVAAFYARRFAFETVVHRADADLAIGLPFELERETAVDAFDEWMDLESLPMMLDVQPHKRELMGPGNSIHFHATDTEAEWLLDLSGEAITWRRAHDKARTAVRGTVTDLLLLVYRRSNTASTGLEVHGDREFLDFWLERVGFG